MIRKTKPFLAFAFAALMTLSTVASANCNHRPDCRDVYLQCMTDFDDHDACIAIAEHCSGC